jgi:hypothetical protein
LATQVFADEEMDRLWGFPEIGRDELFRFFTLTPGSRERHHARGQRSRHRKTRPRKASTRPPGRETMADAQRSSTNAVLYTVLCRRTNGESLEDIRPDLIIPIGKSRGRNPQPGQHLPGAQRTRETPGLPRNR